MRSLKLTSKERMALRAIDEVSGSTGTEIIESTNQDGHDLLDILHGLVNAGLVEAFPPGDEVATLEDITFETLRITRFEINPAFAQDLKAFFRNS